MTPRRHSITRDLASLARTNAFLLTLAVASLALLVFACVELSNLPKI